jgi:hypothetical protein
MRSSGKWEWHAERALSVYVSIDISTRYNTEEVAVSSSAVAVSTRMPSSRLVSMKREDVCVSMKREDVKAFTSHRVHPTYAQKSVVRASKATRISSTKHNLPSTSRPSRSNRTDDRKPVLTVIRFPSIDTVFPQRVAQVVHRQNDLALVLFVALTKSKPAQ